MTIHRPRALPVERLDAREREGDTPPFEGPLRVAVDVGGTFTDLQILEEASGRTVAAKTPTTPEDPSRGLLAGLAEAARRFGFDLRQVTTIMHGTTIATNAVLEHKLPAGALVTTAGFRDVLEIGRHVRRDVYAAVAEPRRLLIERARRFEVPERVTAGGAVREPLAEDAAREVAARVAASGAAAVAVCLLHAYANPAHERRLGEHLRAALGHDNVSLSHAVSPEIREFERTSTTVLNALLMPVVRGYLQRLGARLADAGLAPALYLMQSNGGVASPEAAAASPARLLLSGPSGGTLAARVLGQRLGESELIAADMGGTSFDVSLVQAGVARLVTEGAVDGCPVRLPMVEIRTIGAGGGSIARLDDTGRLHVGPESAGAEPGPVAYRRGGAAPTVTDADLVLGRLDPEFFLGGTMRLDAGAARDALAGRLAGPLGCDAAAAAAGVVRIAVAHMAAAIRLSLFEKGLDPRDFALVAFGGAGGLHAAEVAAEIGAPRVVFPRDAGTLSAYGMLHCDIVHDLARSRLMRADAAALPALRALAGELREQGATRLAAEGVPRARRHLALAADLRYPGQAYEITVPCEGLEPDAETLARICARFHDDHHRQYAHADRTETPELVTLRLTATGRIRKPQPPHPVAARLTRPKARRRVYGAKGWEEVEVYDRAHLGAGASLAGPALVEEAHATVFVPAGWRLACAASGDLLAEATAGAARPRESPVNGAR